MSMPLRMASLLSLVELRQPFYPMSGAPLLMEIDGVVLLYQLRYGHVPHKLGGKLGEAHVPNITKNAPTGEGQGVPSIEKTTD